MKIISWLHEIKLQKIHIWVNKRAHGIVGTNSAITSDVAHLLEITPSKLAISLNPITELQLNQVFDKASLRKCLDIRSDRPLVVYTGKLFIGQREAGYILESAKKCPDYQFLLTGGKPNAITYYKKWCLENGVNNVTFTGYLFDYTSVLPYQHCADVLVSYYSPKEHDVRYNLPNKICEYMLTKNPIVTVNFPAVRDILNAHNAIFVEPENVDALVRGILQAIEDKDGSRRIAEQAYYDVRKMTFKKRTAILIDFFKALNHANGKQAAEINELGTQLVEQELG